jgi:hypothetical protein
MKIKINNNTTGTFLNPEHGRAILIDGRGTIS